MAVIKIRLDDVILCIISSFLGLVLMLIIRLVLGVRFRVRISDFSEKKMSYYKY